MTMDVNTTDGVELIEDFVVESLESLRAVPGLLSSHQQDPNDTDSIHASFRAIHSIKGCAAFLGLDAFKQFAHSLEHTLSDIRDGKQSLSEDLLHAMIEGFDALDAMINRAADGDILTDLGPEEEQILKQISDVAAQADNRETASPEDVLLKETRSLMEDLSRCGAPQARDLTRRLQALVNGCLKGDWELPEQEPETPSASTPAQFHGVPCSCGEHDVTDRVASLLRPFIAMAEGNYSDDLATGFLADSAEFAGWARKSGHDDFAEALERAAADYCTIHNSPLDVDDNLLSLVWDHLWPELTKLRDVTPEAENPSSAATAPLPAAIPTSVPAQKPEPKPDPKPTGKSTRKTRSATPRKIEKTRFVRVKEDRLDEFLEQVSSLFVVGELLTDLQGRMAQTSQLVSLVEELRQIHRDMKMQFTSLQQGVMALRRVSVSGLFSAFPRMARSLASQLGKKINVIVSGEDTEIDKLIAEDLDAPLTHLVRNVVDHAIETPEERSARGMSESGNLWIKAEETRNKVQITVCDDGRGIDPNRLRDKAVEKGIYSHSQAGTISDEEALNLIFHPGFSTAEKVSDVSGRGVGMDVVRTTLAKHDGTVKVESKLGAGTIFRLEIPVREAVLVVDALLVCHAGQHFAIPFQHVRRIIELGPGPLASVQGQRVVTIKGEPQHAVSLSEALQLPPGDIPLDQCRQAVLVEGKRGSLCLLFDQILGHREVVIKGLEDVMSGLHNIAGVAQLGGGQLALVLNVPELIQSFKE